MTAQDPELSAALGWPGNISDPVLDRKTLLQMVATMRLASQQALEVLKFCTPKPRPTDDDYAEQGWKEHNAAITALRAALVQQVEPVEPHRREGDNNIESPFNACMHKTYCMTLKQAEPLNLSDPAVRKRLASQWGYVHEAQQAEPVAGVVLNEEGRAALVEHGREEWHCVSRNARRLYTAPPQRTMVPLTEEEIDIIGITHQSLRQVVRAVERAHGIKE